jgi:hypothetical protein
MTRRLSLLAALLLAGCVSSPQPLSEQGHEIGSTVVPTVPGARYEVESGRDAATVAEMRAAAAPATPALQSGRNMSGDRDRLAAQGYVRIGTGYFPFAENETRDAALAQGRNVGAEQVLLYAPAGANAAEWVATYFVRFKLPFGATFRDLREQERTTLGSSGVAIGSVVGGTPASRANLIAGDFVLAIDGKPVANRADFQDQLKRNAGRSVTLTIVRNGETLSRVVRLGVLTNG